MTDMLLHTERLELRLLTEADVDWLVSVHARPDVGRFIPAGPWTEDIADGEVAKRLSRRGFDTDAGAVSVVATCDGEPVVDLVSWYTDREHGIADIGWAADPEHAGKGYVTEAAAGLLDFLFGQVQMHRVAAKIDPRNTPSMRVAERLGMQLEGHLRENDWMHGEWCDTLVYGMLAGDRDA
ncbi:GNAT family N-acetyltransferase [Leucobacter komagatae]|uniref:N-acetyltransferase domain-containing protein n=1 Tax=Leucobacter komagatae TaxID=55969 RepID=A0A0D0INH2_9MICO|nr:GNAT family protein [Leucobacter komagatae]KIP52632.1 hypothetical protein SD72_07645 [Leucobacter komagatae]